MTHSREHLVRALEADLIGPFDLDNPVAVEFQVELGLEYADGFVARPNVAGEHKDDWDERLADLQFRDKCEFAVGHGVSVDVALPDGDGKVRRVRSAWIPRSEVRRVVTHDEPGVSVHMEVLAQLGSGAEVHQRLGLRSLVTRAARAATDLPRVNTPTCSFVPMKRTLN